VSETRGELKICIGPPQRVASELASWVANKFLINKKHCTALETSGSYYRT